MIRRVGASAALGCGYQGGGSHVAVLGAPRAFDASPEDAGALRSCLSSVVLLCRSPRVASCRAAGDSLRASGSNVRRLAFSCSGLFRLGRRYVLLPSRLHTAGGSGRPPGVCDQQIRRRGALLETLGVAQAKGQEAGIYTRFAMNKDVRHGRLLQSFGRLHPVPLLSGCCSGWAGAPEGAQHRHGATSAWSSCCRQGSAARTRPPSWASR